MKNLIIYLSIFFAITLFFACQKASECLLPEGGCDCEAGYEGSNCDVRVTSKFSGTYKKSSTDPNKAVVKDSTINLTRLYFINVGNGDNIKGNFYGDIDGYHVNIPRQIPSSNTGFKLVEGEACFEKNDNAYKITFKLRFDNYPFTYRFVYYQ
jgi:hypothetical protein